MVGATNFERMQPFDLTLDVELKRKYHWQIAPTPMMDMGPELDSWSARAASFSSNEQFLGHWDYFFNQLRDQSDVLGYEALM